jgi:hypothetical protein
MLHKDYNRKCSVEKMLVVSLKGLVSEFCSWKPVISARELQLNGVSQRGQEPLDTEVEDATSLEAITK